LDISLIDQFVPFYKIIPQEAFELIEKEVDMTGYAETISGINIRNQ